MITGPQQERASLYALGALMPTEEHEFEKELLDNPELHTFTRGLQRTSNLIAGSVPMAELPADLKGKVSRRIEQTEVGRVTPCAPPSDTPGAQRTARPTAATEMAGLHFLDAAAESGWKQLPVPGAYIKLLSLEKERGYAVLLGKIEAGVRYPAHVNAGPEDFYILSGDLVVGDRKLRAGDFHHADSGSKHEVNYSVEGCTLLAVLTTDDPLVTFAMA